MSRTRRIVVAAVVVAVVTVASHFAAVTASPRIAMNIAESRMQDLADGSNSWFHMDSATPENQEVVRSSPDLAYSACSWDLSDGPVTITAPGWDDYFSLSLYDGRTDNFFVANDRSDPDGVEIVLEKAGEGGSYAEGVTVVQAPSETGVALLRYLAPTSESFDRADDVRRDAVCSVQ